MPEIQASLAAPSAWSWRRHTSAVDDGHERDEWNSLWCECKWRSRQISLHLGHKIGKRWKAKVNLSKIFSIYFSELSCSIAETRFIPSRHGQRETHYHALRPQLLLIRRIARINPQSEHRRKPLEEGSGSYRPVLQHSNPQIQSSSGDVQIQIELSIPGRRMHTHLCSHDNNHNTHHCTRQQESCRMPRNTPPPHKHPYLPLHP